MIRYLTAGESHGKALIGIIEGIPAGLQIDAEYINEQLRRRQQGYGRGGRMRIEADRAEIISGVRFSRTIGSPIAIQIQNKDWENWTDIMAIDGNGNGIEKINIPRPGHADYVGAIKYGFDDLRNVIDRSSARETAMRVALCSIARRLLEECGIFIGSHVLSIGSVYIKEQSAINIKINKLIKKSSKSAYNVSLEADKSEVRMLDDVSTLKAIKEIKKAKKKGDTLGGVFEILVTGVPIGIGSYVHFDRKLDGLLAQALISIQAIKGVEIGNAFENAEKYGSEVHDEFYFKNKKIMRRTNNAGGIEGGVTNGETIVLKAAMKPISTLAKPLQSIDLSSGKNVKSRYERSDVCAVPAASVIGEAVIAPILANGILERFGGDSMKELKNALKNAIGLIS